MTIMIIEENPSLRSMIRSVLELGHAEIMEAGNATQALGMLGRSHPDWVVVDLSGSQEDGLTVTERLKRLHPSTKVMLVADTDSLTLREKARKFGIGGILVKERLFQDLARTNFELHENVRTDVKG